MLPFYSGTNGNFDACHSSPLVLATAQRNGHYFFRYRFNSVKRFIWSMTDDLSFIPTVSPLFINRESHEHRESCGDANQSIAASNDYNDLDSSHLSALLRAMRRPRGSSRFALVARTVALTDAAASDFPLKKMPATAA